MTPQPTITAETAADLGAIRGVLEVAFARADEADIVERLRAAGDLALSLVARTGETVVGHVALSPMQAPPRTFGLAPLAVLPSHRQRGIGSALVTRALDWARRSGADLVFVLGDPAYYARFGFKPGHAAGFTSTYAGPHLLAHPLTTSAPTSGRASYARALEPPEPVAPSP